ncbi:MAG: type II toxin-antitoxin system RelE/ParE family toxin [Muribaculaceae bacterium]|nr:type II toxin-antitoxin system RelE/ParE family toxin [Muribaculaceae bacterium]
MKAIEDQHEDEVRQIILTPEFDEFYFSQPEKVQKKFDYVINVMATVYNVSTKFVKHLKNSDLYEMRVSIGSNEYRTILFSTDNPNFIEATQIILLNGFLKKSEKDYKKQIDIAHKIIDRLKL